MIVRKSNIRARSIIDPKLQGDDRAFRFYVMQGNCRKCKVGPNNLIVYDFENSKNPRMAIFKTLCLCCGDKDMYFGRDTPIAEDDEPYEVGEDSVPTTLSHPPKQKSSQARQKKPRT